MSKQKHPMSLSLQMFRGINTKILLETLNRCSRWGTVMERLHCCVSYCPIGEGYHGGLTVMCHIFFCRGNKNL